jgi:magnesium transporter
VAKPKHKPSHAPVRHHRSSFRNTTSRRNRGKPPGTLAAPAGAKASELHVITYDADEVAESQSLDAPRRSVTWIDVVGLGSLELIEQIGRDFKLHALALEDALQSGQRAKVESYTDSLFIVTRIAREVDDKLDIEQVAMFLGKDFVITFQERAGDCFDPVRERIRAGTGRIRKQGASYLAYALLDAAVDAMFPLLEAYDERLEVFDVQAFRSHDTTVMEEIHAVDRALMAVRRAILPLREAIVRLVRDQHPLLDGDVRLYLRDCQDHLTQMVDLLEGQRDLARALREAHLTTLGHRSNEVMKVLTMIATIFIPLSFIAGLYGMNFDTSASPYNMPELSSPWGYPILIGAMVTLALGMLYYFRRKRWL